MKDFFKFMFASMLGFILTFFILFFLAIAFFMAVISMADSEEFAVKEKSVLHMSLSTEIKDRTSKSPIDFMDLENYGKILGLNDILKNIEKAKNDDRIKGIYLNLNSVPSGLATISEIRDAIADFKTSGKFVIAYGEMISQKAYYLASVADKVFLNPEGSVELKGFNGQVMFIKGMLEKLEIEPQIIRHGKFKSAIEPLILDKMSEPNKEQTTAFISSMWAEAIKKIEQNRGISATQLNEIADYIKSQQAQDAYHLGIVDSVIYEDEVLKIIGDKLDGTEINKIDFVELYEYDKSKNVTSTSKGREKVAIIFAEGDIVDGDDNGNVISSVRLSETIREARLNDKIKAVVLRVNSPGGSALASDVILREVKLTAKEKPIVVSMGNLAASGGYYISCAADYIYASPMTITGSIGVFGVIPNFQHFFNNKLGITFDNVTTNKNSDFISAMKPLTEFQREMIQKEVDDIYLTFTNHVAEGRGMDLAVVDEHGQGRVWSGKDALGLGLVDELGGLNKAIAKAAELAELEEYRITELPEEKDPIQQIIEDLFGTTQQTMIEKEFGAFYNYYQFYESIGRMEGNQARLPFIIDIN
jgi:protease-4